MNETGAMSYECVLKCGKPCVSSDKNRQRKWASLQAKAKNWSGLDKFRHVYATTLWQDGPDNHTVWLQSGLVASPELVHDLKTALPDGQAQVETFLQERVFTKAKPLTAIIHRNKKQNFAGDMICTSSGAHMKVAHLEQRGWQP